MVGSFGSLEESAWDVVATHQHFVKRAYLLLTINTPQTKILS